MSATDQIREGDTVNIVCIGYTDWRCTVIRTPAGAGDLWQFRRSDGTVFAQNPYSPRLLRIEKATVPEAGAEAEAGGDG